MEIRSNPQKWATRAAAAAGDYVAGALTPRRSWASSAAASEGNYEAGIQTAISRKAYSKGISGAGDAVWSKGIQEKGRGRYSQGVGVSQDNYAKGFQPYADVLRSISLAPRGPKGNNMGRVQVTNDALRAKKLQS